MSMDPGNRLHVAYSVFHGAALASGDVDPVYPVLREIAREQQWTGEATIKAIFAHVAYYDMGSGLTAFSRSKTFEGMPADLPCATERRAHRMPSKLRAHLDHLGSLQVMHNGLSRWLWDLTVPGDPVKSWVNVSRFGLMRVTGNGRWSSYKTAEMLKEVAGWALAAPDMGHAHSSGPRRGLELLYPELARFSDRNDQAAIDLLDQVSAKHAADHRAPIEQAETTLCDFNSLVKGDYYVGHDIDKMQAQLIRAGNGPLIQAAWRARRKVLPGPYLGELNGWEGVDRERCKAYRDTGQILTRRAS